MRVITHSLSRHNVLVCMYVYLYVCIYREAWQVQTIEAARLFLWRLTVHMCVIQRLHLTLLIP